MIGNILWYWAVTPVLGSQDFPHQRGSGTMSENPDFSASFDADPRSCRVEKKAVFEN